MWKANTSSWSTSKARQVKMGNSNPDKNLEAWLHPEKPPEKPNDLVQSIVATCATFWGRHHTISIRGHIQQVSKDKCLKTKRGFATFNSTRRLVHSDHQQVPVCHIVRAPSACQPMWPKMVPNQAVASIRTASQEDTGHAHQNNFGVSQDASHSVMAWARNRRQSEVLHHLEEWPTSQVS